MYRSGLASMKVDLTVEARARGLSDVVIFVPVSWGNRLLARMRGLGASASGAETAYRQSDHCMLELTLRRAERERWTRDRTAAAIAELGPGGEPVPVGSPLSNGDPTLRLATGVSTAVECLGEIEYDRTGYYNYSPFLADQDPTLAGSLVIARDLRARNGELLEAYPGRAAYVFRNGELLPMTGSPP